MKEKDLYPGIRDWLYKILKSKYKNKKSAAYDTSEKNLNKFIQEKGWISLSPEYAEYEIKVDILGVVFDKDKIDFLLIEVKNTKISLKDISQLIGYTRVVKPINSMILSPNWVSDPVKKLFEVYKRFDVLKYEKIKIIKVCKWDQEKKDIDYRFIYPSLPLF
ncbi:MAG: hypothetical protein ACFFDH_23770 [Promethearchaeota archaeon]